MPLPPVASRKLRSTVSELRPERSPARRPRARIRWSSTSEAGPTCCVWLAPRSKAIPRLPWLPWLSRSSTGSDRTAGAILQIGGTVDAGAATGWRHRMFDRENAIGFLLLGLCIAAGGVMVFAITTGTELSYNGPTWLSVILVVVFIG